MSLTDNLISYWKLDEASGNALDAHGSNTLTETSGTIASATGKVGNARDFEAGDTEYFTIADNTDLSTGDIDFTWQAWLNPESVGNNVIFRKDNLGGGSREYGLYVPSGNTRPHFYVFSGAGGTGFTQVDSGVSMTAGNWYHVVGWHDSVNNQIGIAVNDGTPVTASHAGGVYDGTAPFGLGGDANSAGVNDYDGLIDELGFWKRVLTSGERTELYNSGNGLAYENFAADSGPGSAAADNSHSPGGGVAYSGGAFSF